MFSNLASYLLGYGDAALGAQTTAAANINRDDSLKNVDENLRLTTVETDEDDWLMVETSLDETTRRSRSSSTGSLPAHLTLEESWFVTPPPCFTSTNPVTVETSPLENLLIEHPSMSVYHHRGAAILSASSSLTRRSSAASSSSSPTASRSRSLSPTMTGDASTTPAFDNDARCRRNRTDRSNRGATGTVTGVSTTTTPRRAPLRPTNVLNLQASLLAQKHQNQKEFQAVKNKQLERNNKVRDVNKRNKRQRRADRQKNHSGANNNRKCC